MDDVLQEESPTAASEANAGEADFKTPVSTKPLVGRLTDERIRRLQEIGFVWSLRDDWQKVRAASF